MSVRGAEKEFVSEVVGGNDPRFFAKNCRSCHVKSCMDCHSYSQEHVDPPDSKTCIQCHKGYHVGVDYLGYAPREDRMRYQRGPEVQGRHYLRMQPDVHQEAGMQCSRCHSMDSLARGKQASKQCRDCHTPDKDVIEHRIEAHREKMECYACHSAWAAQEYGTFYLRFQNSTKQESFYPLREWGGEEYVKSAYLKKRNKPNLGLNKEGRVSPIRPQYIVYFTNVVDNRVMGEENRMLSARWKPFFPHTVQSAGAMCHECHNTPRRFLLEGNANSSVHAPSEDGLTLESFWSRKGQNMTKGSFFPESRYANMPWRDSSRFIRLYLKKWQGFIRSAGNSSR